MHYHLKKIILMVISFCLIVGFASCDTGTTKPGDNTKTPGGNENGENYTPTLAKPAETKSIKIYDLAKERDTVRKKGAGGEVQEMYLALLSIQGIVNRDSEEKIYFLNSPAGWLDVGYGWKNQEIDKWALDNGEVPVPQSTAEIDSSKKWPVLSALLRDYKDTIKGGILIPKLGTAHPPLPPNDVAPESMWEKAPSDPAMLGLLEEDNAICAAATCAGQTDGMIMSERIQTYLNEEGLNLDVIADCRELLTAESAFDWAYDNYFKDNTNRTSIRFLIGGSTPENVNSFDYFISTRSFITTADSQYEPERYKKLTDNYPKGIFMFTNYEFKPAIYKFEAAGFPHSIIAGTNLSVHSGFKSDPNLIPKNNVPEAHEIDNDTVYISFYITDGDSSYFSNFNHIINMRNSEYTGQIPIGWSYPTYFFDLYPNQFYKRVENNYNGNYELIYNPYDSACPTTEEGLKAFADIYRNYLEATKDAVNTINYIFDWNGKGNEVVNLIAPRYVIWGYAGPQENGIPKLGIMENDFTTEASMAGATQDASTFESIIKAATSAIKFQAPGEPAFALVCLGDGDWKDDIPKLAKEVADKLSADKPNGRNVVFLTPSDMFATWRSYKGLPAVPESK